MSENRCTAGYAKINITPPLGVSLAGYFDPRPNVGVLDELYVRAVAFGEGEKAAVLIVCDLVNMKGDLSFQWPKRIAERLGLPHEAVFLTHTHTHTGPDVGGSWEDQQYNDWLLRRLGDVAQMALDDRKPVTDVQTAETQTSGMTFVRRFLHKDGHYQTWASDRENLVGPASPADESMRLIRVFREEGPELLFVNFQTHPDTIGGCYVSADYPGELCRIVEKENENLCCVFLQGCEGDLVPGDMMHPDPDMPKGYRRSMIIGQRLAAVVNENLHTTVSTGATGLGFGQKSTVVKTKRDPARVPEAKRILQLIKEGRREEVGPAWDVTPRRAEAGVLIMLDEKGIDESAMPVTTLTFCGVALVGIPGELFCQAGVRIREGSPFNTTCVCSLTNGRIGYFATAEAYDQGGYEPSNSWFVKGVAEQLSETAIELLNQK